MYKSAFWCHSMTRKTIYFCCSHLMSCKKIQTYEFFFTSLLHNIFELPGCFIYQIFFSFFKSNLHLRSPPWILYSCNFKRIWPSTLHESMIEVKKTLRCFYYLHEHIGRKIQHLYPIFWWYIIILEKTEDNFLGTLSFLSFLPPWFFMMPFLFISLTGIFNFYLRFSLGSWCRSQKILNIFEKKFLLLVLSLLL